MDRRTDHLTDQHTDHVHLSPRTPDQQPRGTICSTMIRHIFSLSRQRSLLPVAMVTGVLLGMYVISDVLGHFEELNYQIQTLSDKLESINGVRRYAINDSFGINQKGLELNNKSADTSTEAGTLASKRRRKKKYINPHDFEYVLNNVSICSGLDNLEYVIYVHTAPKNFQRRKTLRETWGQNNIFLGESSRIVFFLGTTKEEEVQAQLVEESKLYGDLVQENFHDSYHNLTYKGIAALKWITKYCPNAKYVFKTDDDTFVNIFMLREILATNYSEKNRFIMCLIWENMPILRPKKKDSCLKWCIGDHMFPGRNSYPKYCSGAAYFLSGDVISELYTASLMTPFFWVDDVYMTGLLTKKIPGLQWLREDTRYRYRLNDFHENYKNATHAPDMMVTLTQNDSQMRVTWNLALEKLTEAQRRLVTNEKYEQLLKESKPWSLVGLPVL